MSQEPFTLLDPPVLVELDVLKIETTASPNGDLRRIAHFRWHDQDFWLLGRMVWHNRMAVGSVFVRPKRGRRIMKTTLMVHPNFSPPEYVVHRPGMRRYPKEGNFVFAGFDPGMVINIEFARSEDRRLTDGAYTAPGKELPIERPPNGYII